MLSPAPQPTTQTAQQAHEANLKSTMFQPGEFTRRKWQATGSGLGFAGGVAYAFANSTGFWKGWGIAIIFGIAGSGIGYGLDQFSKK